MKEIIVKTDEGDILEQIRFSGGYNISYTNKEDNGEIKTIRKIKNARFGAKFWVKNYQYAPIARRLAAKFEELNHIHENRILFLEDQISEKKKKAEWMARIRKANADIEELTGYWYIMELKKCYLDDMSMEQVVALIYHELLHIDVDGTLRKHDIEDWSNMVATLGYDWATTRAQIPDILDDKFKDWFQLNRNGQQMNLWDGKVIAMRTIR